MHISDDSRVQACLDIMTAANGYKANAGRENVHMGHGRPAQADSEYIVVGSGAGGGTVSARLAEAGHTVTLLEAGGDPRELQGGDPVQPTVNRLPHDYDVPVFHAFASENEA